MYLGSVGRREPVESLHRYGPREKPPRSISFWRIILESVAVLSSVIDNATPVWTTNGALLVFLSGEEAVSGTFSLSPDCRSLKTFFARVKADKNFQSILLSPDRVQQLNAEIAIN